MSSYFSLPSFARAKKNKEQLEKTNPQNQVLKDEDEQFLNKHIESSEAPKAAEEAPAIKTTESDEKKEGTKEEAEQAGAGASESAGQAAVPEEQPQTGDGAQEEAESGDVKQDQSEPKESETEAAKTEEPQHEETKTEEPKPEVAEPKEEQPNEPKSEAIKDESKEPVGASEDSTEKDEEPADDPPEQAPDDSTDKTDAASVQSRKSKKNKPFDLPSQEEAEAATKGFDAKDPPKGDDKAQSGQGEKKTWTAYLPSMRSSTKKDATTESSASGEKGAETDVTKDKPADENTTKDASTEEKPTGEKSTEQQAEGQPDAQQRRTWVEYASSAYSALPSIPAIPSIPSLPESWRSKDGKAEPVYNEDGTIDEAKTKEKQEREASVLLDHLNLSSINNRVFAFSGETEKIYERFTQVLKDTMTGAPTAYDDMEKLMKDAGPELEKQFQSMPPFVQTLVKSLPAKLGTGLGPELLAAASQKPGGDMKARMAAASKKSTGGDPSINVASSSTTSKKEEGKDGKDGSKQKKKRTIPGLKGLISEQGMVASILRNVVTFLKVRFPFLASMTNVVMSLAVFSKSSSLF